MHLATQALCSASLQACHWNKGKKISNKRNIVKNRNWQEADQLAIFKAFNLNVDFRPLLDNNCKLLISHLVTVNLRFFVVCTALQ